MASRRTVVVLEVPCPPIAVNMLARLADGLPPVAAMFKTIVIVPLVKFAAFATESPNIGRVFFKQEPRHLLFSKN